MPSLRVTTTVAVLRLPSSSDAGLVELMAATASKKAVTVTVPVVSGPVVSAARPLWRTVTLMLASESKSVPSKARVNVAWVALSLVTDEIVVPVGAPLSRKSVVSRVAS